jgi:putative ABC transport system permease protein
MSTLKNAQALLLVSLRSVPQRLGSCLVGVIGIAGVVGVMVSVIAMSGALQRTVKDAGDPGRAIVLRSGAESEGASTLPRDAVATVQLAPGIARSGEMPLVSPEVLSAVTLKENARDAVSEVTVRGIPPIALKLRPEIQLVAGRLMNSGVPELIVGRAALRQFAGLTIGSQVPLRDANWTVVGIFTSNGDAHESELIADSETLLASSQRNVFQSVTVRLESPQSLAVFKEALTTNPSLSVDVLREDEYYQGQSRQMGRLLILIVYLVGGIMSVGATFAALNTMYSMVSSRTTEIATVRALGFGQLAIVISVLVEGVIYSLVGALLGTLAAWLLFGNASFTTFSSGTGHVVAQLDIDAAVLSFAATCALIFGLAGALFPAVRAARLPIAVGMRAH